MSANITVVNEPGGKPGLFSNRNVLSIFLGETVQLLGNKIYYFCLPWYIYGITKSSLEMGTLSSIQMVAPLLFGILIGIMVDHTSKKKVIMVSSVLSIVMMGVLYLCGITHNLSLILIYLFGFSLSMLESVFETTYRASIPLIVNEDHLAKANSLETILLSIAGLAGPTVAGILVGLVGPINSIGATLAMAVIALLILSVVKIPQIEKKEEKSEKLTVRSYVKMFIDESFTGFRFLKEYKAILVVTMIAILLNFGLGGTMSILIFHLRDVLHLSSEKASLVYTFSAIGMLIGGFTSVPMKKFFGTGRGTVVLGTLCGLMIAFMGYTDNILLFCIMYMISTTARYGVNVCFMTTVQMLAPKEHMGKIFATIGTLAQSTSPLGMLIISFCAKFTSTTHLFLICGLIISISSLSSIFTSVRKLD